jgi:hypothetical protein
MTVDAVRVFVSYAHESEEHKARVLDFATFLRGVGVEAVLDTWAANVRRDWSAWAIAEMTAAEFVLVVASDEYRRSGDGNGPAGENRGIQSEAALLRELVHRDRSTWLPKILPVVLPGNEIDQIPLFLQPYTASHFRVPSITMAGAEELLRVILTQPGHSPPEVNPDRPVLPARTGVQTGAPEPDTEEPVINKITGTVHGKVIQAHTIQGDIHF